MWWVALLAIVFLVLGLRAPKNRSSIHAVAVLAIVAVLVIAFLRMRTYPSVPSLP